MSQTNPPWQEGPEQFQPNPAPYSQPAPYPDAHIPMALPYSSHSQYTPERRRPGIISAIGIMSIIISCLGGIGSLVTGCQSASFYMISSMSNNMNANGMQNPNHMHVTANTWGSTSQPSTALTPSQLNSLLQNAQQLSGNRLTQPHLDALTTALSDPSQQLVFPGSSSPLINAVVDMKGNATVIFTSGSSLNIDAQGQFTNTSAMPTLKVNKLACGLVALDALLGIILAVFLLVAGILIMRQRPSGRGLHLTYAIIKIPLVIGGSAAIAWMNADFYGSAAASAPGAGADPGAASAMQTMGVAWGIGMAVVGLIYPVSLLIALNTRGVREYFRSAAG